MTSSANTSITKLICAQHDADDPLRHTRERFDLPVDVTYLDGNSLGALPRKTAAKLQTSIREQWGRDLIRSWNSHSWVNFPHRIGDRIAQLLGAVNGEVVATDSTSVNIFKLLAGALNLPDIRDDAKRRVILSEIGNFPTDLYMAQGINTLLENRYELKLVSADQLTASLDETVAVALITQVDYCSGHLHNMANLNAKARQAGTHIVWDLSHSAGAVPVALHDSGAEMAVGCGYKYLNGGPGAPAYLYLAQSLQANFATPLAGWFGHQSPFLFTPNYVAAPGIERLLCGTPSVLAMQALDCGIDTFEGVEMSAIRTKSLALSDLFWALMEQHCASYGFTCVSPRDPVLRASQLSFAHDHAYEIMQAIIDRGVIGDFRQPNLLRFGFTPLYTRYIDVWNAVMTILDVMQSGAWQDKKYQHRNTVT